MAEIDIKRPAVLSAAGHPGHRTVQTVRRVRVRDDGAVQARDLFECLDCPWTDYIETRGPAMLAEETRDEILRAAMTGEAVLVASDSLVESGADLEYVAAGLPPEFLERVRRTNGAQELEVVGGGRVFFRSVRSRGGRGLSVDLLVVPVGVWDDGGVRAELGPCLAARGGSVHLYCRGAG